MIKKKFACFALTGLVLFSALFLFSTFSISSRSIYCIPYLFPFRAAGGFCALCPGYPPSAAALFLNPPSPFGHAYMLWPAQAARVLAARASYCQGIRRAICPHNHLYGPAPCLFLPNSSPAAARHRSPDRVYLLVPAPPVSGSSKAAEASWMFTALIRTLPASEWRNV